MLTHLSSTTMVVIIVTCSAVFLVVLGTAVRLYILLEKRRAIDSTPADAMLGSYLHGMRYRAAHNEERELVDVEGETVAGHTAQDLLGENSTCLAHLIHPEDRALVEHEIQAAIEGNEKFQVNYRLQAADGRWRWVRDRGVIVRTDDGEPLFTDGILLDISERVSAEIARVKAEKKYNLLAESVEELICVHDADGRIEYVTPSAKRFLGYDVHELTGKALSILIHQDDRGKVLRQIETRVREEGREVSMRFRLRTKFGTYLHVETRCSPSRDSGGYYTRFVTASRDITELVQLKRELEERRRSEAGMDINFLANMSDELRTPLTSVIGFADLLADEVEAGQRETVEIIRESGERLLSTLSSMMEFTATQVKGTGQKPKRVNIVPPVEAEVQRHQTRATKKGVRLQFVKNSEHVFAVAGVEAVSRLADHLLSNALKFTESEGCVTVAVLEESEQGVLRVSDTGIGISEEFLPFVFEPFRQESTGLTRNYPGVGIGLSIVKRLAESFGGQVEVDSEKGKGSVFTVRLPNGSRPESPGVVTTKIVEVGSQREDREPEKRYGRVLAVDDNDAMRILLSRHLRGYFEVETAEDPKEAIEAATREEFDVIILDINLGTKKTGMDVLKELRDIPLYKDGFVIALTAYALPEERTRFIRAGFDGYVAKPFTRETLVREISRVTMLPLESEPLLRESGQPGSS